MYQCAIAHHHDQAGTGQCHSKQGENYNALFSSNFQTAWPFQLQKLSISYREKGVNASIPVSETFKRISSFVE